MKVTFIILFLCVACSLVAADCNKLTSRDACTDNCWCVWRTEDAFDATDGQHVVLQPAACMPLNRDGSSPCNCWRRFCKCEQDTSTKCTIFIETAKTVRFFIAVLIVIAAVVAIGLVGVAVVACSPLLFYIGEKISIALFPLFDWMMCQWYWVRYVALLLVIVIIAIAVYFGIDIGSMYFQS